MKTKIADFFTLNRSIIALVFIAFTFAAKTVSNVISHPRKTEANTPTTQNTAPKTYLQVAPKTDLNPQINLYPGTPLYTGTPVSPGEASE